MASILVGKDEKIRITLPRPAIIKVRCCALLINVLCDLFFDVVLSVNPANGVVDGETDLQSASEAGQRLSCQC